MEYLRRLLRNWLGFSRTEVNGFLILLPLMIMLIASEPVYRWWASSRPGDFSKESTVLDSLIAHWKPERQVTSATIDSSFTYFPFNPNTCSLSDLRKLGFDERLSRRIVNYREKGGTFRIKRDLLKIYGVDSTFYNQLFSYILLPGERSERPKVKNETKLASGKREPEKFDLNTADTALLKTIYGIGPSLAARIVRFREGLGGFVSTTQVGEVYGLDSAVVSRLLKASLIAPDFRPEKININSADEKILSAHPYISRSLAKAIVAYRFQHGKFNDVKEVTNIPLITSEESGKLIPYLTIED